MDGWKMAFEVIGGLGIFMLGMRYMSDGLQRVSGPALRKLINYATTNRMLATVVGLIVTVIVQSSSVTSVITVGLVNSGVMQLKQALGIMLGANIGTTITGWILVIKIGKYGLPILGIFAICYLFSKNEKFKYIAMAIMGIGMIFFGLELMSGGFKPFRTDPTFKDAFKIFNGTTYLGVLGCALVGCILTFIVQSSSATLGITLSLVGTGVIEMEAAAALVFGENIGTTITAYLASLGTSTNAKRTAYFHIIFNVLGVLWVTSIFSHFFDFAKFTIEQFHSIFYDTKMDYGLLTAGETPEDKIYHSRMIFVSSVHSLFNITNVLVFLPFLGIFDKLLNKYVKDKKVKQRKLLTHLEYRIGDSPFAQVEMSAIEVQKMGDHTKEMMSNMLHYYHADDDTRNTLANQIFQREDILDKVQKEITHFLTMVMKETLSNEMAVTCRSQLIIADEYETISDYIMQILKLILRLRENNLNLAEYQVEELTLLSKNIEKCFEHVLATGQNINNKERASKVKMEGKEIVHYIKTIRSEHWQKASNNALDPLLITTFADIIVSYRKVVTHLVTIAETLAEEE